MFHISRLIYCHFAPRIRVRVDPSVLGVQAHTQNKTPFTYKTAPLTIVKLPPYGVYFQLRTNNNTTSTPPPRNRRCFAIKVFLVQGIDCFCVSFAELCVAWC